MTTRYTENFTRIGDPKMVCSCCGKGQLSIAILVVLEMTRAHFGKPVTLLSGARCAIHNKAEGGAKNSEHLIRDDEDVDAVDITVQDVAPQQVYLYLKNLPFANLLGLGKYKGFTHVDTRGYAARW